MKIKLFLSLVFMLAISCKNLDTINKQHHFNTALLTIKGMACQKGCANKIQENILQLKGISKAIVSYSNANATITYNPKKVTIEQLKSTITKTKVKDYKYTIVDTSINTPY